jgi:hypothetical protein
LLSLRGGSGSIASTVAGGAVGALPLAAGPHARPHPAGRLPIDPFSHPSIDLFAAGVADARNMPALRAAATWFGGRCFFLDPRGRGPADGPALADIRRRYDLVLALETGAGARNLFTYRLPAARHVALLVGNERRGLAPAALALADGRLAIPMRGHGVQSLNVAGAAAVALAQLTCHPARGRIARARAPHPALILAHSADSAELGSALRAAWTLGWNRVGLIDSHAAWFTRDRATYVQGRGAARRHKNPLSVYPCRPADDPVYDHGIVVMLRGPGPSLWRTRLPLGRSTAVFLPDESGGEPPVPYQQMARTVQHVSLDLPGAGDYHYRLVAAVVLAELARRLGGEARQLPGN